MVATYTYKCTWCDETTVKADGNVAAHDYTIKGELVNDATCQGAATYTYKCTWCDETTVKADGDVVDHDYTIKGELVSDATCNGAATYTYKCTWCDETTEISEGDVADHDYTIKGELVDAATCQAAANYTYKCTWCDETTVKADGDVADHDYTVKGALVDDATCQGAATYTYKCTWCDETTVKADGDVADHDYTVKGALVDDATCQGAATYTYKCTWCDETTVKADGGLGDHNYDDGVVTDPTFDAQGYTTYTCGNCGHSYTDNYVDAKAAQAAIGEVKYETLQAAINAAEAGATVKLLAGVELDKYLKVANKITLDLDGNAITYNGSEGYGAIYVAPTGDLTIVGDGSVTAAYDNAIGVYGNVTIENGTFNGGEIDEYFCAGVYAYYYNETTYGTVVVNGGTFNRIYNCGVMTINGGTAEYVDNTHKLTVSDGDIKALVVGVADYAPVLGTITEVSGGNIAEITAAAQIGKALYATLAEAVAAAQDNDTVVVLADVELDTYLKVANKITLDLNGKAITYNGSEGYGAIYVAPAGDLTVTGDGSVTATYDDAIATYGKVTIENGIFNGGETDEYICAGVYAYYYNETTYGTVVVNGGTFNRIHNCGVMTINGGTVTEYVDNTHKIAINNGEIAELIFGEADYAPVFGTVTEINGGHIAKITSPVQIGGDNYASVEEAVEAAKAGDTITLSGDCTAKEILVPENVILDLNGSTLKVDYFIADGDIVDSSEDGSALIVVAKGNAEFNADNSYLPMYDTTGEESGYRLYSFSVVLHQRDGANETETRLGVQLIFDDPAAFALIENDVDATGFEVCLNLEISGLEKAIELRYTSETLKEYAEKQSTARVPVIAVTVTGLDKVADRTVTASTSVNSAGVAFVANSVSLTK